MMFINIMSLDYVEITLLFLRKIYSIILKAICQLMGLFASID